METIGFEIRFPVRVALQPGDDGNIERWPFSPPFGVYQMHLTM